MVRKPKRPATPAFPRRGSGQRRRVAPVQQASSLRIAPAARTRNAGDGVRANAAGGLDTSAGASAAGGATWGAGAGPAEMAAVTAGGAGPFGVGGGPAAVAATSGGGGLAAVAVAAVGAAGPPVGVGGLLAGSRGAAGILGGAPPPGRRTSTRLRANMSQVPPPRAQPLSSLFVPMRDDTPSSAGATETTLSVCPSGTAGGSASSSAEAAPAETVAADDCGAGGVTAPVPLAAGGASQAPLLEDPLVSPAIAPGPLVVGGPAQARVPDDGSGGSATEPGSVVMGGSVAVPVPDDGVVGPGPAPGPSGGAARPAVPAVCAPPLPVAPADGDFGPSGGAGSTRVGDMLAAAVARGITPLREDIAGVKTTLGELVQAVDHLRLGHQTLARGHERVLTTMAVTRVDFTKAVDVVYSKLDGVHSAVTGGRVAPVAGDAMTKIIEVKRRARAHLEQRTGQATVTSDVCLSTARSWQEIVGAASEVLDLDEAAAAEWLLGYADLPTRKNGSVVKSMRRCTPILRVKAHIMHVWKQVVLSAYFSAFGIRREDLSESQGNELLVDLAYLRSVRGFPAVLAALEALLLLLGARERVVQPSTVGDLKVINCTTGHVALVTSFVRVVIEVLVGTRAARGGVGEGIYDVWVQELSRVDGALPRDCEAHDGLRLVDGADPSRALLPDDDDDDSPVDAEDDAAEGCRDVGGSH